MPSQSSSGSTPQSYVVKNLKTVGGIVLFVVAMVVIERGIKYLLRKRKKNQDKDHEQ